MDRRELIGKLIIQENISTIDNNKIPRTFVINVPDPGISYYTRFTEINKPSSIIFVTKEANSFEKILRVTQRINKEHNLNIDGAKCEVRIGRRKLNGVRVKGLSRYSDIESVQQHFKDHGFEFARSEKFKDKDSLIRINRFFDVNVLEEGIYKSNIDEDTYYVEVPKFITWEEFREYTFDIKNNLTDRNYDIVKGIMYYDHGIIEILRIIKPKATLDSIKNIQDKYKEKLV